jgi:hypothetical protein
MKVRTIANVRVGKPDTTPSRPSHVKGVREGNQRGGLAREKGFIPEDGRARATAARSTGINPAHRNPMDPRMPNVPPP